MRQKMIGQYLKDKYHRKIYKLNVDGGFSCPNRSDNGSGGCLFCSERGSGDFTESALLSLAEQVEIQKQRLTKKWSEVITIKNERAFLIHFQNYSGTYGTIDKLRSLYNQAMEIDNVLGLVVSTRPDLIDKTHIELFKNYPIHWVELGLQTVNDGALDAMCVGYHKEDFERANFYLKQAGIPVVAHVIYGLPKTNEDDFYKTIAFINNQQLFGVKIHMLNILQDSPLAKLKTQQQWQLEMPTQQEYIDAVKKALALLNDNIIIHRLTGDGAHDKIIAPMWVKNKRKILNRLLHDG